VPLFGTRKLERVEENVGALDIELTSGDLEEFDAAGLPFKGERYLEAILKRSGL
jgi:aryl-alcohol dehydrogenase-like predicted oxidoreductase